MMRAVTSASNVFRRRLCPASERLEAECPEDRESPQSKEGDLLHAYDANPKLERAVLKPNQQYLLRVSAALDEVIFKLVCEKFSIPEGEPFEEGVNRPLCAIQGKEGETPGTCDRWRLYPAFSLLIIVDKKFGFKIVTPAASNDQLRTYAIGGYAEWGAENIAVAITQPRLPFEERITLACYTSKDIEFAIAELTNIRAVSRREDAPAVPGEDQCRYCRAKVICEAYQLKMTEGLALVATTDGATVAKREFDTRQALARCTSEQRDKILTAIQFADYIKDEARDFERDMIASGQDSMWQVGKSKATRDISNSGMAISLLRLRGDLTQDDIHACCKLGLSDLTEKIREKKKCTWDKAKEILDSTLETVLARGTQKPSLTRKKK